MISIDVTIALSRPPRHDKTARVHLSDECCIHHATLTAIWMVSEMHKAVMPVDSNVVDWPEDAPTHCGS